MVWWLNRACQKFCVHRITFHQGSFHASPKQESRSQQQSALPQLSQQMLKELVPGPVTKE
jgi:hypothetical protein